MRHVRVPDPAEVADVADLLPAAKAACAALAAQGRPLTRTALTGHLRKAGHPVSNARVGPGQGAQGG